MRVLLSALIIQLFILSNLGIGFVHASFGKSHACSLQKQKAKIERNYIAVNTMFGGDSRDSVRRLSVSKMFGEEKRVYEMLTKGGDKEGFHPIAWAYLMADNAIQGGFEGVSKEIDNINKNAIMQEKKRKKKISQSIKNIIDGDEGIKSDVDKLRKEISKLKKDNSNFNIIKNKIDVSKEKENVTKKELKQIAKELDLWLKEKEKIMIEKKDRKISLKNEIESMKKIFNSTESLEKEKYDQLWHNIQKQLIHNLIEIKEEKILSYRIEIMLAFLGLKKQEEIYDLLYLLKDLSSESYNEGIKTIKEKIEKISKKHKNVYNFERTKKVLGIEEYNNKQPKEIDYANNVVILDIFSQLKEIALLSSKKNNEEVEPFDDIELENIDFVRHHFFFKKDIEEKLKKDFPIDNKKLQKIQTTKKENNIENFIKALDKRLIMSKIIIEFVDENIFKELRNIKNKKRINLIKDVKNITDNFNSNIDVVISKKDSVNADQQMTQFAKKLIGKIKGKLPVSEKKEGKKAYKKHLTEIVDGLKNNIKELKDWNIYLNGIKLLLKRQQRDLIKKNKLQKIKKNLKERLKKAKKYVLECKELNNNEIQKILKEKEEMEAKFKLENEQKEKEKEDKTQELLKEKEEIEKKFKLENEQKEKEKEEMEAKFKLENEQKEKEKEEMEAKFKLENEQKEKEKEDKIQELLKEKEEMEAKFKLENEQKEKEKEDKTQELLKEKEEIEAKFKLENEQKEKNRKEIKNQKNKFKEILLSEPVFFDIEKLKNMLLVDSIKIDKFNAKLVGNGLFVYDVVLGLEKNINNQHKYDDYIDSIKAFSLQKDLLEKIKDDLNSIELKLNSGEILNKKSIEELNLFLKELFNVDNFEKGNNISNIRELLFDNIKVAIEKKIKYKSEKVSEKKYIKYIRQNILYGYRNVLKCINAFSSKTNGNLAKFNGLKDYEEELIKKSMYFIEEKYKECSNKIIKLTKAISNVEDIWLEEQEEFLILEYYGDIKKIKKMIKILKKDIDNYGIEKIKSTDLNKQIQELILKVINLQDNFSNEEEKNKKKIKKIIENREMILGKRNKLLNLLRKTIFISKINKCQKIYNDLLLLNKISIKKSDEIFSNYKKAIDKIITKEIKIRNQNITDERIDEILEKNVGLDKEYVGEEEDFDINFNEIIAGKDLDDWYDIFMDDCEQDFKEEKELRDCCKNIKLKINEVEDLGFVENAINIFYQLIALDIKELTELKERANDIFEEDNVEKEFIKMIDTLIEKAGNNKNFKFLEKEENETSKTQVFECIVRFKESVLSA